MATDSKDDMPKTVGELRQRLAKADSPWEADPRLGDDDPLPDRPRGGQIEEDIPEKHRLRPLKVGIDLKSIISKQPPANPFLRARWAEVGMLEQEDKMKNLLEESGKEKVGDTA